MIRDNISPILPYVTWLRKIFDQYHHHMLPGSEERGRNGPLATKPDVNRLFLTITTNKGPDLIFVTDITNIISGEKIGM